MPKGIARNPERDRRRCPVHPLSRDKRFRKDERSAAAYADINKINMPGRRFGRWTVVSKAVDRITSSGRFAMSFWRCRCDCGIVKDVRAASLLRNKSKSCGCYRAEEVYEKNRTHGQTDTPEYRVWMNMRNRCRNPKLPGWKHYGGRGIVVTSRWDSFELFLIDMGCRPSPQHSLDRIQVNGPYCKENCRWATTMEQLVNRRKFTTIDQFTTAELLTEIARRSRLADATASGRANAIPFVISYSQIDAALQAEMGMSL